jgi:hypothetical protein
MTANEPSINTNNLLVAEFMTGTVGEAEITGLLLDTLLHDTVL